MIMESTDVDGRQRMRALENLGKINSVGLFSDKIEINVTHRSLDAIETELAKTLELYMGKADEVDNELDEIQKAVCIGSIDVAEELGTKEKPETE
jgi:hypothetical protein